MSYSEEKHVLQVRFQVHTAASVFWDAAPFGLVKFTHVSEVLTTSISG
jgi:hypothetical protein